jgi:hypothetical protein
MRAMYSAVGIAAGRGITHTLHRDRVKQVLNTGNPGPGGVQEGGWMGGTSKCRVRKTRSSNFENAIRERAE